MILVVPPSGAHCMTTEKLSLQQEEMGKPELKFWTIPNPIQHGQKVITIYLYFFNYLFSLKLESPHYGITDYGVSRPDRFLRKNQHTQKKLLNFENRTNGEPQ